MNVLYLSLGEFDDFSRGSVHIDLVKKISEYHTVYLVCKQEKKLKKQTEFLEIDGIHLLKVRTGNIKNINLIEKLTSILLVSKYFKSAIKRFLPDVKFDLVIYTTPPITFVSLIQFIKKRDNCICYLLLKDIFPQNAVDLGLLKTHGFSGVLYKYFRKMEKKLYAISDFIGCMSPANCKYILSQNNEISPDKVGICPNSIDVNIIEIDEDQKRAIRNKYNIPINKRVFVYGGNLGKPQGIPFLIECMKQVQDVVDAFFLIVGNGTEFKQIEKYIHYSQQANLKLLEFLPREDYLLLIRACDVGMIFLDHRFTVPNFPSRLLGYMEAKLPVLAVTDPCTDIGKIIQEGEFGWWCESNDSNMFHEIVNRIINSNFLEIFGETAYKYLIKNYTTEYTFYCISSSLNIKKSH